MSQDHRIEPRVFAVYLQWKPNDIIVQQGQLTWQECWDALQSYRRSPRPPHACAMALVLPAPKVGTRNA